MLHPRAVGKLPERSAFRIQVVIGSLGLLPREGARMCKTAAERPVASESQGEGAMTSEVSAQGMETHGRLGRFQRSLGYNALEERRESQDGAQVWGLMGKWMERRKLGFVGKGHGFRCGHTDLEGATSKRACPLRV